MLAERVSPFMLFYEAGDGWKVVLGVNSDNDKNTKDLTSVLASVVAVKLTSWSPRDTPKQCLQSKKDVIQCRDQLSSAI